MSNRDESLDALFPVQPAVASNPSEAEKPVEVAETPSVQPPVVKTLAEAAEGLTYISETDAPLTPFFWPDEPSAAPTPELVAAHTKREASEIKSQSVAVFFKNVTKEEDWHNEAEKAEVKRFQALQETVKSSLKNAKVFRIGEVEIAVYLVGVVEGGYAGLGTKVVET